MLLRISIRAMNQRRIVVDGAEEACDILAEEFITVLAKAKGILLVNK